MRIAEMIEEKKTLSSRDFAAMQADLVMVMARDWVPVIRRSLAPQDVVGY